MTKTEHTERRKKAAKKGAETRAVNRLVEGVSPNSLPSSRRMENLLNRLLKNGGPVDLLWNPLRDTGHKLKNGGQYGTLVKFLDGGRIWRVLPEGYKRPLDYHPAFWEPLYGSGRKR